MGCLQVCDILVKQSTLSNFSQSMHYQTQFLQVKMQSIFYSQ